MFPPDEPGPGGPAVESGTQALVPFRLVPNLSGLIIGINYFRLVSPMVALVSRVPDNEARAHGQRSEASLPSA